MKTQITFPTPAGEISITAFSPNEEVHEIYIDILTPQGEKSIACVTLEEEPETGLLDFCTRLYMNGDEEYSSKVWHDAKLTSLKEE